MGWYKEREGNSGKEEKAIYESRQRQFDGKRTGGREGRPVRPPYREERTVRSRERETRSFRGSDERDGRSDRDEERGRRDYDREPRREGGYRSGRREGGHREERGRSRQASWE